MSEVKEVICFETEWGVALNDGVPQLGEHGENKIRIFSAQWIPSVVLTSHCPKDLEYLQPSGEDGSLGGSARWRHSIGKWLIDNGYNRYLRETNDLSVILEYFGPHHVNVQFSEEFSKATREMALLKNVCTEIAARPALEAGFLSAPVAYCSAYNHLLENMGDVLTALLDGKVGLSHRWPEKLQPTRPLEWGLWSTFLEGDKATRSRPGSTGAIIRHKYNPRSSLPNGVTNVALTKDILKDIYSRSSNPMGGENDSPSKMSGMSGAR